VWEGGDDHLFVPASQFSEVFDEGVGLRPLLLLAVVAEVEGTGAEGVLADIVGRHRVRHWVSTSPDGRDRLIGRSAVARPLWRGDGWRRLVGGR